MTRISHTQRPEHAVDVHVGNRIRLLRRLRGLNQAQLATVADLSFQQLQKYENGASRISASRLWQFANALGVPVSFFFDDMDGSVTPPADLDTLSVSAVHVGKRYDAIADDNTKRAISDLVSRLAR